MKRELRPKTDEENIEKEDVMIDIFLFQNITFGLRSAPSLQSRLENRKRGTLMQHLKESLILKGQKMYFHVSQCDRGLEVNVRVKFLH